MAIIDHTLGPARDPLDTIDVAELEARERALLLVRDPRRVRPRYHDGRFLTATDLADWLVKELGLPFREAHHVTGALVKRAEDQGKGLGDLSLAEMQAVEPRISDKVYPVLKVENSVAGRKSEGGTAPDNVRAAAKAARARFLGER